ncbi:MAG: hypothetical protein V7784_09405 [Oceanospirillaceae bacterium]
MLRHDTLKAYSISSICTGYPNITDDLALGKIGNLIELNAREAINILESATSKDNNCESIGELNLCLALYYTQ